MWLCHVRGLKISSNGSNSSNLEQSYPSSSNLLCTDSSLALGFTTITFWLFGVAGVPQKLLEIPKNHAENYLDHLGSQQS